jgi:hypothetical protein
MPTRNITRQATNPLAAAGTPTSAPIYVDSDDNRLKMIPAGSGTTEVVLQEASGASLVETVITTRVLTAADSGKTFFLALVGGFTVTLPVLTAGFHATFIVAIAPTTAYIIIADASQLDSMAGGVHSSQATSADTETAATADQFNFVASQAVIGDRLDIWSDGTSWFGTAFVALTAGGTFTG